jgi:Mlc titration factor MtfA (ptsG expression regulator)
MLNWLRTLGGSSNAPTKTIPDTLWMDTLLQFPFLARRPVTELQELHALAGKFLKQKEFSGARGLKVTDEMAVAIAAQACLPVLHLGLRWYDDFKGIVVHPGTMLARREVTDHAGVVHRYNEELLGEAMQGGPVTLSWQEVAGAGNAAEQGHNVVIHEFIHKIDMRDGAADGCPPLPSRGSHASWHSVMQPAFDEFCEKVAMAKRFGAAPPWLDDYAASAPAEFFAVACEAYFVNRERFTLDFARLTVLFDKFFIPAK